MVLYRTYFVILFVICCCRSVSAIHIETVPRKFNDMLTPELNVSCIADGSAYWAKTVSTIKLGKKGEQPMVIYNCMELSKGPRMGDNMQAEGHIEKDASKCFLRLSIRNPGSKDAGTYRCIINYLDESFQMKEDEKEANVTVDNQDVQEMVKNLITRISVLENSISYQQNATVVQGNKLDHLVKKDNIISGFQAGYLEKSPLKVGQALKFEKIQENMGNNFDETSGVYTAPVNGLYVFNLFAMSRTPGQTEIQLMANGQRKAILLAEHRDNYDQSSINAVVKLMAGQAVNCVVHYVSGSHNRLYSFPYTGFTGHLVHVL